MTDQTEFAPLALPDGLTDGPGPKPKPKATANDLYPEISSYSFDPTLSKVLRQNGKNPDALQKELNAAIGSGDGVRKAQLLNHYADLTDRVLGNNSASNFLANRRALLSTEAAQSKGSVSKTQAFLGLTGNGLVDLAESLPKLAVAAYGLASGKEREWERANKSIESTMAPMRTFVSEDYQKGLASYDSETGLDLNLDAKSLIGTAGSLFSYILPGLLTAGAGTVAGIAARSTLRGAVAVGDAALVAAQTAKLGKIGSVVTKATGLSSFLQMFPSYQSEALQAGLSIKDATLLAIPVAALNGYIETANMGALTKALGLSKEAAAQTIRQVTMHELGQALTGLAGKPITAELLMDTAEGIGKNALGRISRPKEMGLFGKLANRVGTGFKEQGMAEGGEEFLQSLVENASRQFYNNFGAATGATEGNGKFKDPTLGNYVFDAMYGTLLGTIVGTGMGTFVQKGMVDPTVFGFINADVRNQVAKLDPDAGAPDIDALTQNLKVNYALDIEHKAGRINDEQLGQIQKTVRQMAETAVEFSNVEGFTDSDRFVMFNLSAERAANSQAAAQLTGLKDELSTIDQNLQGGQLSPGESLKAEIRRNQITRELGGPAMDDQGQPIAGQFQAEQAFAARQNELETLAGQTLAEYDNQPTRSAVKDFFHNKLTAYKKQYSPVRYQDDFTPTRVSKSPVTGEDVVHDDSGRFFRIQKTEGGKVRQPMSLDADGNFVPSQRESKSYSYEQPIAELPHHLALTSASASGAMPSVEFAQPDNSLQRNRLDDGRDLLGQLSQALNNTSGKPRKGLGQSMEMAQAYVRDTTPLLGNDTEYGAAFSSLAGQLNDALGKLAQGKSKGSGAASTSGTGSGTVDPFHNQALPANLGGARPNFRIGPDNFTLQFRSDVDKALFITSQTTPSKRDAEYRRWLGQLGYTNTEVGREGAKVRQVLKAQAQDAIARGSKPGDTLKVAPIAAEPAAQTSSPAAAPVVDSTVAADPNDPLSTQQTPVSNGQTTALPANPPVGAAESQLTPEQLKYDATATSLGAIDTALDAEQELADAIEAAQPNADGSVDLAAVIRLIAATQSATDSAQSVLGEDSQRPDLQSTPDAGNATPDGADLSVADSAQPEIRLPNEPLTMYDAVSAVEAARGESAAAEFENDVFTVLGSPRFLKASGLFFQIMPERTTATGRTSQKRGAKNGRDMRMELTFDWFQSAAEVLAGQRKEQTSPAADAVIRKLTQLYALNEVEVEDRLLRVRAGISWKEFVAQAEADRLSYPSGMEEIQESSLLMADQLLDSLSQDDIDLLLSMAEEIQETAGEDWLPALLVAMNNSFPPVSDTLMASVQEIIQNFSAAQEAVIFDNADEQSDQYQSAASEYRNLTAGLQGLIAQQPSDVAADAGGTGAVDGGSAAADAAAAQSEPDAAVPSADPALETLRSQVESLENAVVPKPPVPAALDVVVRVSNAVPTAPVVVSGPVVDARGIMATLYARAVANLDFLQNGPEGRGFYKIPGSTAGMQVSRGEVTDFGYLEGGAVFVSSNDPNWRQNKKLDVEEYNDQVLRAQAAVDKISDPAFETLADALSGMSLEDATARLRAEGISGKRLAETLLGKLPSLDVLKVALPEIQRIAAKLAPAPVPVPVAQQPEIPARIEALLKEIDQAIAVEASVDPQTSAIVAPIDAAIATLGIEQNRLAEPLANAEAGVIAAIPPAADGPLTEQAQERLAAAQNVQERIRERAEKLEAKKQQLRDKKVDIAQQIVAPVAEVKPVDRLAEKLEEIDEEERAMAQRLNEKLKRMSGTLSANPMFDAELVGLVGEYFGIKIKKGVYQFAKITRDFVRATGEAMTPDKLKLLRGSYAFYRNMADDDVAAQMDGDEVTRSITTESVNEEVDALNKPIAEPYVDPYSLPLDQQPVSPSFPIDENQPLTDVLAHDTRNAAEPAVVSSPETLDRQATDIELQTATLANQAAAAVTVEQQSAVVDNINSLLSEMDSLLDAQYDSSGATERDDHETGSRAPARKARMAVTRIAKSLATNLGLSPETDKKGKAIWATENIAPAGGDVSFYLWADGKVGERKGVYVSFKFDRASTWGSDTLNTDKEFLYRSTTEGKEKHSGFNTWGYTDITSNELNQKIKKALGTYERVAQPEPSQPTRSVGQRKPVSPRSNAGQVDLFSGVLPGVPAPDVPGTAAGSVPKSNSSAGVESAQPDEQSGQTASAVGFGVGEQSAQLPDADASGESGSGLGVDGSALGSGSAGELNVEPGGEPAADQSQSGLGNPLPAPAEESLAEEPAIAPVLNARNFRITPEVNLIVPGKVGKVKANIEAIKTLKALISGGLAATEAEKAIMARYVGWGGLAEYLNSDAYESWVRQESYIASGMRNYYPNDTITNWGKNHGVYHRQIVSLLSEDELARAKRSTLNAHYTERRIINSMWEGIRQMGFRGGKVLEPAGGIGHFIGLMPEDLSVSSRISAVEEDIISGQIMGMLYPDADVRVSGFENVRYENGTMDLVISNVPFGDYTLFDSANPDLKKLKIHNYFIARSARLLRPGGIAAIITTAGTMDAAGSEFRRNLAELENVELVSAVRLPSSAFAENAGTEVTTDILFLRKKSEPAARFPDNQFQSVVYQKSLADESEEVLRTISINEYFANNPDQMIGEMKFADEVGKGGLYRGDQQTLYNANPSEVPGGLAQLMRELPTNTYDADRVGRMGRGMISAGELKSKTSKTKLTLTKGGQVMVEAGEKMAVVDGAQAVRIKKKTYTTGAVLREYVTLKDTYAALRYAEQQTDTDEASLADLRKTLNMQYDRFTGRYGELNRNKDLDFIEDIDKEFFAVQALETVTGQKMATGSTNWIIGKASIFKERVYRPVVMPEYAGSVQEAMQITKSFLGKMSVTDASKMLGMSAEVFTEQALKTEVAFQDPATGELTMRDDYLSGNVRNKLLMAQQAAETDPSYAYNVRELEAVLPRWQPVSGVGLRPSSTWIPTSITEDFIESELSLKVSINFNKEMQAFTLTGKNEKTPKNLSLGGGGRTALQLMESSLNSRPIKVTKTVDKKPVVDQEATAAAQMAKELLDGLYVDYVKDNHAEEVERVFNEMYNSYVDRKQGLPVADHYPGTSGKFTLYDHQKRAVERIKEQDLLLAHDVGTGKTLTMITAAMELKRLGLASKSLMVVHNSTVEQFRAAFLAHYPAASVYLPTQADMEAKNRKRFLQRIAANNFDAVVIPISFIKAIPEDPAAEQAFLQEELNQVRAALEYADENEFGTKKLVKDMERITAKMEAKQKAQADRKQDDILDFSQLGIDALFLDESHNYKKPGFYTRMQGVKGVDTAQSEMGYTAMAKIRSIQRKGGRVVMATGTPITNTMAEAWNIMRFLSPTLLADGNIESFDQFAGAFGKVEDSFEITPQGNFKNVKRFAKFTNIQSMSTMFRRNVDVKLADEVVEFKQSSMVPLLKENDYDRQDEDGNAYTVRERGFTQEVIPQTPGVKLQMEFIRARLQEFDDMTGLDRKKFSYIPLQMFGRAAKATLDTRLISASNEDEPGSKTNKVVETVFRKWQEMASYSGTQLVFSDMYQSPDVQNEFLDEDGYMENPDFGKERFNLFEDMRAKWIAMGVPAEQIAIVPADKNKRPAIFDKVVTGEIRILMGTTEPMGVGVNVQNLLGSLHHMNGPKFPADFIQRNGRILRQGNLHAQMGKEVEIFTYGVDQSMDATSYQRLGIKQKFINQVLKGEMTDSEADDLSDDDDLNDMSFDQMMARLSGSQWAMLLTQKQLELKRLDNAEKNFNRSQSEAYAVIRRSEDNIKHLESGFADVLKISDILNAQFDEDLTVTSIELGGQTYTNAKEWADPVRVYLENIKHEFAQKIKGDYKITINGAVIELYGDWYRDGNLGRDVPGIYYVYRFPGDGVFKGGSFSNTVGSYQGLLASFRSRITSLRQDIDSGYYRIQILRNQELIAEYGDKLNKPFKDAAKIEQVKAKIVEIQAKMTTEVAVSSGLKEVSDSQDVDDDVDSEDGPDFQLNESPAPTQSNLTGLATRLSETFGVPVVSDPSAYRQALAESGALGLTNQREPIAFRWKGTVYLSPRANSASLLHEYGGLWAEIARSAMPELYAEGVRLATDAGYLARVQSDRYYSTLDQQQQEIEAVETAIGELGGAAIDAATTPDGGVTGRLRNWLSKLWAGLRRSLGFNVTTPVAGRMSMADFMAEVTGQMLAGRKAGTMLPGFTLADAAAQQQAAQASRNAPSFQLPTDLDLDPQTIEDMRGSAQAQLENITPMQVGDNITEDLFTTPLSEWTAEDRYFVKGVEKATGWRLTAPGVLSWVRPKDLLHLADGTAIRLPGNKLTKVLARGFVRAYNDTSNRGRLFRTVVDRMKSWTNLESFIDLLDDAEGSLASMLKDLKRVTARRSAFARITLEPLRMKAEAALANFSLRAGNTLETVRTVGLNIFDYDETGAVVRREVVVPVALAMELVMTHQTQLESYGQSSIAVEGEPEAKFLYKQNTDGSRTRRKRGGVYYDAETDQTHYLIMESADIDALINRFETGDGGYEGEAEGFAALSAFYNQDAVTRMLEEENGFLNPDSPFVRVENYHPIRTVTDQTDARQQSRGFSRTLDEARQLITRQSAADAVLLRDPMTTMNDYEGSVSDILEHGRLVESLNGLLNGLESDYEGPRKREIISYLQQRRDDYQSHRQKRAEAYQQRSFVHWLEAGLRRYTQSVFSLNVGLPLKQTGTYAAALGQNIIGDEFLRSGEACGVVTRLTAAAYRDWEAPSTVVPGSDQGFQGSLTGADTQERELLEEIAGVGMSDPLEMEKHQLRYATVLNRLTSSQTLYTGDVEWEQLGLNRKTLTNAQKMIRGFDEWNSEYGLAAMKRADRAVILAYYTAAKLQAQSEGLTVDTPDNAARFHDRVADLTERTLYATNQMANLTEQTPLQTSTDFVAKILGLYSGQQQKLLNTVLQSLNKYVKTGEGSEQAKAALVQMAKTFGWAVLFNAGWVSLISAGSAALMAILSGDDPKNWEETKTRMGWDFVGNVAGTVPSLGSQAVEYWISQIDDRPGTDPLLQITAAENLQTGLDIISGAANYLLAEDAAVRDKKLDSLIYDVTDFTAKSTGIPSSLARLIREHLLERDQEE